MIRMFAAALLVLFSSILLAQAAIVISEDVNPASAPLSNDLSLTVKHYRLVKIDIQKLYSELAAAPHRDQLSNSEALIIELPLPDGSNRQFKLVENSTMAPELADKFPEIKTYDAYGIGDSDEFGKLDLTSNGFHAMIMIPGKDSVFIDPVEKDNTQYYRVYYKKDFRTKKKIKCGVQSQNKPLKQAKSLVKFAACELKKYRLAMAATAQYTAFYGGTVAGALAGEVTTVNRVNGIYEREAAITLQLIANNAAIIYTNPNNQPYTSGNPEALIEENQDNLDAVIGSANYDIGHVVDAAGSGLASLGSVCDPAEKAKGATGQTNPIGDPFDVDYVAHEIGHQFGANHVQNNSCQRNNPTAVEPGSGSTIMGYAGICAPNVQANSSAYFNGISLQEIGQFVSEPTHTCAVKSPIFRAPVIRDTDGFHYIPVSTPFSLTAVASSPARNLLTYTWEQMNNEVSIQPPVSTATGGPNFRSIDPSVSGTRFFPNLISLANNGPFTWEVLPSVSRILKFRVSVRSNIAGGSCNAYTDVTLTTTANAGPFVVTYPNAPGVSWLGDTVQPVMWNVANTNLLPVNAQFVDILLSIDGGITYPYVLLKGALNAGIANVTIPSLATTTARIMVRASNGNFFNISANNFSILTRLNLTQAERNPMNKTEAFIYYTGLDTRFISNYSVNGLANATVTLDPAHRRLIVGNILTPRKINVSITVVRQGGISETSNLITIPGIL
ncbi:hypothetical protein Lbir_1781 [Legionella birminghamensis]|uniref:Peptidase M12B domain-containing protein n=1 Tax=Legionella birminghamensis TaxID=28083 RepID=A0A378IDN4_9GAMM|nr:zinc-dependent metalloprotease family protein [Legionella birminghamensis]KTC70198.1 hypothetical protein Lbir_1781 [Legionella birminghamensis]STX30394.1 Uncharacterised protein [Legionella birminghamensis]